MLAAIGLVASVFLFARFLYDRIYVLRRYFFHPPLIGGILIVAFGPEGAGVISKGVIATIAPWPGVLVSFLFAGLILSQPVRSNRPLFPPGFVLRQSSFVWFIALGQIAVGLSIALLLGPLFGISPLFGHLIEIGWTGGHGSASAMLTMMEHLGNRPIGELALFSATVGLVWGGITGMAIVNVVGKHQSEAEGEIAFDGAVPEENRERDDVAPFSLAVATIALSVGLAALVRAGVVRLLAELSLRDPVFEPYRSMIEKFPLFFVALVVAFLIRRIAGAGRHETNPFSFLRSADVAAESHKITGMVLDALILTAVASITLTAFLNYLAPFLIVMLAGAVWAFVCFFIFAPRMLPKRYWKELGILNYGMSTGITALGLLLLRSFPSSRKEEATVIYGLAAPFSAPFIGGGMISLFLPEFTARGFAPYELGVILIAMVALYWSVRRSPDPSAEGG